MEVVAATLLAYIGIMTAHSLPGPGHLAGPLFLCMASAELYGQVPDIHVIPVGVPGPGSRYAVQVLRASEGLTRRSGLLDRF